MKVESRLVDFRARKRRYESLMSPRLRRVNNGDFDWAATLRPFVWASHGI